MNKKIIILNGSPRKNGNTAMLCDAFAEGAQSAGHTVTRFDLQHMNIHGCLGCMKGGKNMASPCVQKDDMDEIYPAYKEAGKRSEGKHAEIIEFAVSDMRKSSHKLFLNFIKFQYIKCKARFCYPAFALVFIQYFQ